MTIVNNGKNCDNENKGFLNFSFCDIVLKLLRKE